MINVIADRAMLGAFTREERLITPKLLREAASEVFDSKFPAYGPRYRWLKGIVTATVAGGVILGIAWALTTGSGNRAAPEVNPAPAAQPAQPESAQRKSAITRPVPADDRAPTLTADPADAIFPERDPVAVEPTMTASPGTDSAPTAESPAVEFETLLSDSTEATDTDNAFATLFGLWGIDYMRGTLTGCQQAQNGGLYCLFQRGSLAQVRSLDRPVILSLRDSRSRPHQVVLSGLEDDRAIVSIGDDRYPVSLEQLREYWFGDYLLLWRPRVDEVQLFIPGMRHADVKWLRESLATIQGEPVAPMDSDLFDQNLESRVRNYQRERRLTVDGLVGYQTQIAINTDLSSGDRPRLARAN
jgi:general secretion pathway protein A